MAADSDARILDCAEIFNQFNVINLRQSSYLSLIRFNNELEKCRRFLSDLEMKSHEDLDVCLRSCQSLLDFAWENINVGHWKDVPLHWRELYSYAAYFKSLTQLKLQSNLEDILVTCDNGLLMGAPVEGNILAQLAGRISKSIGPCYPQLKEKADILSFDTCQFPVLKHPLSIEECPSLETFLLAYFTSKTPVLIRKAVDHWPCMSSRAWSFSSLLERLWCRTFPVEIGSRYTDSSWTQRIMRFDQFVDEYVLPKNNIEGQDRPKGYLAQHQIFHQVPELRDDLRIPEYCCVSESETDPDVNIWLGPTNTVSPLHYDPKHNVLVQIFGHKYVRLYAESETWRVYPHQDVLLNNTSQVDLESPDLEKYPLFGDAVYSECVLCPCEILYIPPKCWHFVKSLSPSCSVSYWFE